MTRGIKKYRPASELKDHHELIKIAAGIRTNDRRPAGLRKKMVYHVTELLKLFANDPTLGVRDPAYEAEEARRVEERRILKEQKARREQRSRALDAEVAAVEAKTDARHAVEEKVLTLLRDARRYRDGALTSADFYNTHGLSIRAARVLASFGPEDAITGETLARAAPRRIAREIEKAFAGYGVTILPTSPDGPLAKTG